MMKYINRIVKHYNVLGILFLFFGFVVMQYTNINFFMYSLIFLIATFISFWIEYNENQSKFMNFLRKYF